MSQNNTNDMQPYPRGGFYCRTAFFNQTPDENNPEKQEHQYIELAYDEGSAQFKIYLKSLKPNKAAKLPNAPTHTINQSIYRPDLAGKPLSELLPLLHAYELAQVESEYPLAEPLCAEDENIPHYVDYAIENLLIPDIEGRFHDNVNGRPLAEGRFDPAVLRKAKATWDKLQATEQGGSRKAPAPPVTGILAFSRVFKSSTKPSASDVLAAAIISLQHDKAAYQLSNANLENGFPAEARLELKAITNTLEAIRKALSFSHPSHFFHVSDISYSDREEKVAPVWEALETLAKIRNTLSEDDYQYFGHAAQWLKAVNDAAYMIVNKFLQCYSDIYHLNSYRHSQMAAYEAITKEYQLSAAAISAFEAMDWGDKKSLSQSLMGYTKNMHKHTIGLLNSQTHETRSRHFLGRGKVPN